MTSTMAWLLIVTAGILEVGWVTGLKYTEGFSRFVPSMLTITGMILSMYLLAIAARYLPLGTAYAVWVGIGSIGAVMSGIILFGESITPLRLIFLSLLIFSLLGLRFTEK